MTIKASAAGRIDALVADLRSNRAVVRDAAVARLVVIGTRAVTRLVASAEDAGAPAAARVAALRALEAIDDVRGLEASLALMAETNVEVAIAAIRVAGSRMRGQRGVAAIDRLAAAALDAARPVPVREAALRALGELEFATLAPLLEILSADAEPAIRGIAIDLKHGERRVIEDPAVIIAGAARGTLPDLPESLRMAVVEAGARMPLPDLRQLIDALRDREAGAAAAERPGWLHARAAVHAALARRGSRLAVFDLRETLSTAPAPLPVEFLAALVAVGDASCLEAIAAAWERAQHDRARDAWWQRHLVDAFQAIVAREGLTGRHTILKRIEKRWPDASGALRGRPPRQ